MLALAAAIAGTSCKRDGKSQSETGADLGNIGTIAITVHGESRVPLTRARLAEIPPHYHGPNGQADPRRAWRLVDLLGSGVGDGDLIVASGQGGISITYKVPGSPTDQQPVLMVSRKGVPTVTLVDPGKPFPDFHGHGGQRGRAGDPTPRVVPVARIEVVRARSPEVQKKLDAMAAAGDDIDARAHVSLEELEVRIDGKRVDVRERISKIESVPVGDDHAQSRPGWNLRSLASALGGTGARVSAVRDEAGVATAIPEQEWADVASEPVLRSNRRGQLKYHVLRDKVLGPTVVRRVSGLDIVTR